MALATSLSPSVARALHPAHAARDLGEAAPPARSALAPSPDFRYVGLSTTSPRGRGAWASALAVAVAVGASACPGQHVSPTLVASGALVVAALAALRARGLRATARETRVPSLAIVPWGVLVETDERLSALHWAAIDRVQTDTVYGRDLGTPTTRYSLVTIETHRERLVGRVAGAACLDRLLAHLDAYTGEAAHGVALDLDGHSSADGPSEPSCETLLSAARAFLASGAASDRLDLPALGYRSHGGAAGSEKAQDVLGSVLRDRTPRANDPRPFAAVVAAELHALALTDVLVSLVQSPHPIVAAVAKVAALKLGASQAKVGALDEVEPFLLKEDARALAAWLEGP